MTRRTLLIALSLLLLGAAPAQAAPGPPDFGETAKTWEVAADRLGLAGSIWEPMRTFGLERRKPLTVLAGGLTFGQNAVTGGDTTVVARYANRSQTLDVSEKWANTGWVRAPRRSAQRGLVGRVRVRMAVPFAYTLPAVVYANCGRSRCAASDVLKHGGQLVMTARAGNVMTEPSQTSVVLSSRGLSYSQLLAVARSLEQVAGTIAFGAGSAQMQAMCRQMISGAMSAEAAIAFAEQNQYAARVGSIDGQPQAVTLDHRQGRFTLTIVANAVTACTYE